MEFSLINLLSVLLVAWLAGSLVARLGYPAILGELLAGVIFGPPLLGLIHDSEGLKALSEVGVFLMMLYIGMEVKSRDLLTASRAAVWVALGSFLVPYGLGFAAAVTLGMTPVVGLFVGLILGITSLATKSRMLMDLNLLGTHPASVMLAAALVCDTLALVVFALISGVVDAEGLHAGRLLAVLLKAVVFFGLTIWVGVRIFPHIGQLMRRVGFNARTANFTLVIMIGLVFAELAELAGLHAIVGAFLAGMFLREEVLQRKLSSEVTTIVHDLSIGFLAPIFFVSAGFLVDLSVLRTHWPALVGLVVLSIVGKLAGTLLGCLPNRRPWREATVIGFGMSDPGAVGIIIAQIAYASGIIDEVVFTILVAFAIVSTCITPVTMRWGAGWLRARGELAPSEDDRKGVLIAGAGPLACAVAREFARHEPVWVVDSNAARCRAAEGQGFQVLEGDALEEATLETMDADHARLFLAMTANAQVNQLAVRQARTLFGMPSCFTTNAVGPLYPSEVPLGLWNEWIGGGETRRTLRRVTATGATEALCRDWAEELDLPLVVRRAGRLYLPAELQTVKAGDEVLVARRVDTEVDERFLVLLQQCPILDLAESLTAEACFGRVAPLLATRLHLPEAEVLDMLVGRERECSTVIVPGLAIPHILIEGQDVMDLIVCRCRAGVVFGEEGEVARLIFVLAGTRDQRSFHLRALASIARMFQNPDFEGSVMDAGDEVSLRDTLILGAPVEAAARVDPQATAS